MPQSPSPRIVTRPLRCPLQMETSSRSPLQQYPPFQQHLLPQHPLTHLLKGLLKKNRLIAAAAVLTLARHALLAKSTHTPPKALGVLASTSPRAANPRPNLAPPIRIRGLSYRSPFQNTRASIEPPPNPISELPLELYFDRYIASPFKATDSNVEGFARKPVAGLAALPLIQPSLRSKAFILHSLLILS